MQIALHKQSEEMYFSPHFPLHAISMTSLISVRAKLAALATPTRRSTAFHVLSADLSFPNTILDAKLFFPQINTMNAPLRFCVSSIEELRGRAPRSGQEAQRGNPSP